jgi:hypothetical protein
LYSIMLPSVYVHILKPFALPSYMLSWRWHTLVIYYPQISWLLYEIVLNYSIDERSVGVIHCVVVVTHWHIEENRLVHVILRFGNYRRSIGFHYILIGLQSLLCLIIISILGCSWPVHEVILKPSSFRSLQLLPRTHDVPWR